MTDLIDQINDPKNRGTKDPTVVVEDPFLLPTKEGNRLDKATANNYVFEAVKAGEAIQQIIDKEAEPIEGGGSFQWMYWRYQSKYVHPDDTDIDKVTLQLFEQGFKDNSGVFNSTPSVTIIKKAVTDPKSILLETDSDIEPEVGTNLIAIGHKSAGSYLVEYQKFQGAKDTFRLARPWVTARDYQEGHLVTDLNVTYECIVSHISSAPNRPPSTAWIARTFVKPALYSATTTYTKNDLVHFPATEGLAYKSLSGTNLNNQPDISPFQWIEVRFVPGVDYSPLTKGRAQDWINAGAGWLTADVDDQKTAVVDPNVIILDDKHPRTWVDTVTRDSVIFFLRTDLLQNGGPIDTARVLVDGVGLGDFAGNDPNGVSKDDAVIEYRGLFPNGDWFVFKSAVNDREVFSYREGESYTFNPCEGPLSFVDGNGACIIGSRSPGGWRKGAYQPFLSGGNFFDGEFNIGGQFNCRHVIKFNSGSGIVELGNEKIADEEGSSDSAVFANFDPTQDAFAHFAGLNFAFPWPRNSNGIPYGGVTIGEKINLKIMDFLNMHQNHDGSREWFGKLVEDLFPIQGFQFWHLIDDLHPLGIATLGGDYTMGLWLADRSDNEIIIEYTHSHNRKTLPMDAPISKRKTYRGLPGFATIIPPVQPEILEIFNFRTPVRGGIYTKDSFDGNGRYISPGTTLATLFLTNTRFFNTEKLHISVDAFRMSKPLVKTNVRNNAKPDRNIEPKKIKVPDITSDAQLQNLIDSKELVFNFEEESYPCKTELRCDVAWGDPVYYEDDELIDESDDSLPNTRKVVADSIIYTVSKPAQGPGGHLRTLNLKTRIWP